LIALRWHSSGSQVRLGLSWACRKRRRQKLAVRNTASTPTPSFTRRGLDRRSNPGAVEMPSLSRSCPRVKDPAKPVPMGTAEALQQIKACMSAPSNPVGLAELMP
jgi:hypothetical protein